MWRIVGNIYRVLQSASREQINGFIRCPACKGCGMATKARRHMSKNCHSSNGQPCWFCEGHGVLPLTALRGFVYKAASYDLPPTRTNGLSSLTSLSNSFIHKINDRTLIKFQPCLGTKCSLFNTFKYPTWLANALRDQVPHVVLADRTKPQEDMLFGPPTLHRAFRSAVLLISLLAYATSSHSANAQVNSRDCLLDLQRMEGMDNEDNGTNQSDAIFQIGNKLDGYGKPCRRTQKRRNHLREKAVEEAELRARAIFMALVPRNQPDTNCQ